MNISQIRCFLTAAKYMSFTKAAEKLYLSQPGLSRQVSSLETELGVTLFERGKNSIRLTEAGRICEEHFERIMEEFANLTDAIEEYDISRRQSLTIGGIQGQLVGKCYEHVLSWFWSNRPDTVIHMEYYPSNQLFEALKNRKIDIAVLPERDVRDTPNISYKRSRIDRLCLVVPKDHPKANKPDPSIFDFKDETFLMLDENDSDAMAKMLHSVLDTEGFAPADYYTAPTFGTLCMLLETGAGVSVLNKWHSLRDAPYLKFLEVPEIGYRAEAVAWRTDTSNPNVKDFVDLIQEIQE